MARNCSSVRTTTKIASARTMSSANWSASRDVYMAQKLPPEALEPVTGNPSVMGRVLGIAMAEVVLHGPEVCTPVGQVVAAGMAQHVRPDAAELSVLAGKPYNVVHRLPGHLGLPFGQEQPGQIVFPDGKVALDGAQLVACDGMLNAEVVLEPGHP